MYGNIFKNSCILLLLFLLLFILFPHFKHNYTVGVLRVYTDIDATAPRIA